MSDYFMMIGSPGKTQVRGPHRGSHHAGWLEIESLNWTSSTPPSSAAGVGNTPLRVELVITRRTDQLSTQLLLHSVRGTWFDVIVVDVWDRVAQKSKVKLHFGSALITSFTTSAQFDTFSVNFASMQVGNAAGAQTAASTWGAMQSALGQAAM